jgi:hypothetical protein
MIKSISTLAAVSLVCIGMNVAPALADSSMKKMNISIQPLGIFAGRANVSATFGVADSIAIGPSVSYSGGTATSLLGTSTSMQNFGFGVSSDFFLGHQRYTDGVLMTLGLEYAISSVGTVSASGIGAAAQVGYGWYWNSGFNITLEGGIGYSSAQVAGYSFGAVLPVFGFGIGYAF